MNTKWNINIVNNLIEKPDEYDQAMDALARLGDKSRPGWTIPFAKLPPELVIRGTRYTIKWSKFDVEDLGNKAEEKAD